MNNPSESKQFKLTTPVALIVFNRPDVTQQVFSAIAAAKPARLYIIGDGARDNRPGEYENVHKVREIVSKVTWPCEVLENFSDVNLGCRNRIVSGLNWLFSHEESAIILEDDCLPSKDFFRYCQELLQKYADAPEVSIISGTNLRPEASPQGLDYFFSRYVNVWGWASWRRVWSEYDPNVLNWPKFRSSIEYREKASTPASRRYWGSAFDSVYHQKIDTWDYQLTFLNWFRNTKAVVPSKNLISNIGFGSDATHTFDANNYHANRASESISFPLVGPSEIVPDPNLETETESTLYKLSQFMWFRNRVYLALPSSFRSVIVKFVRLWNK